MWGKDIHSPFPSSPCTCVPPQARPFAAPSQKLGGFPALKKRRCVSGTPQADLGIYFLRETVS